MLIINRLIIGEFTKSDKEILQTVFPKIYDTLVKKATFELKNNKDLTDKQRQSFDLLVGSNNSLALRQVIRLGYAERGNSAISSKPIKMKNSDPATRVQRISGGF